MPRNLLIDTDVLIDYLTAREEAVAELYAGVREGKERVILDDFIEAFEVVPLTIDIAQRGGLYRRDYGKSHGVGLADSIIAATAEAKNVTLVTLNQKHFPMITNLLVPYRKP
jgi:hypothetical protein